VDTKSIQKKKGKIGIEREKPRFLKLNRLGTCSGELESYRPMEKKSYEIREKEGT